MSPEVSFISHISQVISDINKEVVIVETFNCMIGTIDNWLLKGTYENLLKPDPPHSETKPPEFCFTNFFKMDFRKKKD